jgi:hypothetical protein
VESLESKATELLGVMATCEGYIQNLIPQIGTDEGKERWEFNVEAREAVAEQVRELALVDLGHLGAKIRIGKVTTAREAIGILSEWKQACQAAWGKHFKEEQPPLAAPPAPPEPKPIPKRFRDAATEARDKWIYEQCLKGVAYDTIAFQLKKKAKWDFIDRKQAGNPSSRDEICQKAWPRRYPAPPGFVNKK